MTIARYTFLPWLRRGIANQIRTPAGAGASRATVPVELTAFSDRANTPLPRFRSCWSVRAISRASIRSR